MPLPDVTQEVWKWARTEGVDVAALDHPDIRPKVLDSDEVVLFLDLPTPPPGEHYLHADICVGTVNAGRRGNDPDLAEARGRLAARAPTFLRLLEEVLKIGAVPEDLEDVIYANLHRACPTKYPAKELRARDRVTAWAKLLADDLV